LGGFFIIIAALRIETYQGIAVNQEGKIYFPLFLRYKEPGLFCFETVIKVIPIEKDSPRIVFSDVREEFLLFF